MELLRRVFLVWRENVRDPLEQDIEEFRRRMDEGPSSARSPRRPSSLTDSFNAPMLRSLSASGSYGSLPNFFRSKSVPASSSKPRSFSGRDSPAASDSKMLRVNLNMPKSTRPVSPLAIESLSHPDRILISPNPPFGRASSPQDEVRFWLIFVSENIILLHLAQMLLRF